MDLPSRRTVLTVTGVILGAGCADLRSADSDREPYDVEEPVDPSLLSSDGVGDHDRLWVIHEEALREASFSRYHQRIVHDEDGAVIERGENTIQVGSNGIPVRSEYVEVTDPGDDAESRETASWFPEGSETVYVLDGEGSVQTMTRDELGGTPGIGGDADVVEAYEVVDSIDAIGDDGLDEGIDPNRYRLQGSGDVMGYDDATVVVELTDEKRIRSIDLRGETTVDGEPVAGVESTVIHNVGEMSDPEEPSWVDDPPTEV